MSSPTNDNEDDSAVQDAAVAAVDSMNVNEDNYSVHDAYILVPETKANDDDADILVDEMSTSVNYVLAEKKEAHFREIDLMQDSIMKDLKVDRYRKLSGEEHG
jgi:hypothetical protein